MAHRALFSRLGFLLPGLAAPYGWYGMLLLGLLGLQTCMASSDRTSPPSSIGDHGTGRKWVHASGLGYTRQGRGCWWHYLVLQFVQEVPDWLFLSNPTTHDSGYLSCYHNFQMCLYGEDYGCTHTQKTIGYLVDALQINKCKLAGDLRKANRNGQQEAFISIPMMNTLDHAILRLTLFHKHTHLSSCTCKAAMGKLGLAFLDIYCSKKGIEHIDIRGPNFERVSLLLCLATHISIDRIGGLRFMEATHRLALSTPHMGLVLNTLKENSKPPSQARKRETEMVIVCWFRGSKANSHLFSKDLLELIVRHCDRCFVNLVRLFHQRWVQQEHFYEGKDTQKLEVQATDLDKVLAKL